MNAQMPDIRAIQEIHVFFVQLFFIVINFLLLYICFHKQVNLKKMFTKETLKTFAVTLTAVMVGLAVHQMFVSPVIVKRATVK